MERKASRTPIEDEIEVDLLKPVDPPAVEGSECYGVLWKPDAKDCSKCNFNIFCGMLTQRTNDQKSQKIEAVRSYLCKGLKPEIAKRYVQN